MSDDTRNADATGIAHGTNYTYTRHGCRCEQCARARREYRAGWRKRSLRISRTCATVGCRRLPSVAHNNGYCATCNRGGRALDTWDGGRLLRREMQARAMTQHALGAAIGLSPQRVNALVAGRTLPSVRTALAVERVLGISAQVLLYLRVDAEVERARAAEEEGRS